MTEEIEARAPNYELAEIDYAAGMKYKDIAAKYNVSLNTVKSWKTRYKWTRAEKKCVHTKTQKVRTQPEKVCTQNHEVVADEVKQVMSNQSLTDKQRLFCLYYVRSFNATKAYQKAYGVDYSTAASIGYRLMENAGVRTEIQRLKQSRINRTMLDADDLFQKYMDIAFADMNDFAELDGFFVKAQKDIDGTIVSEVAATANGVKIKLNDRMKALDWLAEHMELASTNQRIQFERLKIDLLKAESEIKKNEPAAESGDDGFLDALRVSAKDVWADET